MKIEQDPKPFDPNEALQRLEQSGADKDLVATLKHLLQWQKSHDDGHFRERAERASFYRP